MFGRTVVSFDDKRADAKHFGRHFIARINGALARQIERLRHKHLHGGVGELVASHHRR
jgi:hypothetical protein